jgi:hypothetical protein
MAFVNDLEDINSVCMTAVAVCSISGPAPTSHRHWSLSSSLQLVFHPHGVLRCAQNLLEKYNIAPTDIGRLEVWGGGGGPAAAGGGRRYWKGMNHICKRGEIVESLM